MVVLMLSQTFSHSDCCSWATPVLGRPFLLRDVGGSKRGGIHLLRALAIISWGYWSGEEQ